MKNQLAYLTIGLIGLLAACTTINSLPKTEQAPNIIFLLTDDQRWDALGYAGNSIIQTPAMDELARQGTYFEKAFVTTPICAASRASLLSGVYERLHDFTFQKGPLRDTFMLNSYPVLLKQKGYYTGYYGKFGVKYENAENLFDEAELYDRNNKKPNKRGYFYKTIKKDTVHLTRYTGHKGQEFIKKVATEQPFCLTLSFSAPHAHDAAPKQYFWQEQFDTFYQHTPIPAPALADATYFQQLPAEVQAGFNRTRWHWRYDTPEKYIHSVKGYYRMISGIDAEIAALRKLLEAKGIADNTIIILMGDNGYYLGERQLAGKWLMHDNSLRVPLVIYDPRLKKHRDISDMVLNIDVPRTILDYAGVDIPSHYQGQSLVPLTRGLPLATSRDTILVEHLWEFDPIPSSEGIRSNKWKYFRYRFIDAPEELYDLEKDALEINNLALDPDYQVVLRQMRQKCDALIVKYKSPKLIKKVDDN